MAESFRPVIVVVAYNRPDSLTRLLESVSRIQTQFTPHLYISIDNAHEGNAAVESVAKTFDWPWEKTVVKHPENLGLREHILKCGGLCETYGSAIILEDDLIVSPSFYDKAVQMLEAYSDAANVAGISLYTYPYNESAGIPFKPVKGTGDVHLMRQVSSWGQAWTAGQWRRFITWYEPRKTSPLSSSLPANIRSWPESSWKKYFIDFVSSNDQYIVYPNRSLTSNCGDPGTHFAHKYDLFRTELDIGTAPLNLPEASNIDIRYDIHHELEWEVICRFNPELAEYEFDVDIHGMKAQEHLTSDLILTSRECRRPICSFGCDYHPIELNVLLGVGGDHIHLARKEDVIFTNGGQLRYYRVLDSTPRWIHDALGTSMKDRLLRWSENATRIKALNRLIGSIVRLIVR